MLTLRRKRLVRDDQARAPMAEFSGSDEQLASEIARLSESNRKREGLDRDRTLLQLRNQAGIRRVQAVGAAPRHPDPDFDALPVADGLPEFSLDEVTPGLLRAAVLRDGCLLVRGLMPRAEALRLAGKIGRSFAERERHDAGQRFDAGYYEPFCPDTRLGVEPGRHWIKNGGGVLAVDAPSLSFQLFEVFARTGLADLVEAYLGEPPLITVHKSTLRKAEPSVPGAWHQDGKFMGEVRALNLWVSLTRCGDDAPGLDIVPCRIDHHVTTQTDEAFLDHAVSQRAAEEAAGGTPILRPIFEAGDALLFDELFLHKTGSDPSMRGSRFALENWFFGPSAVPVDYAPLAV